MKPLHVASTLSIAFVLVACATPSTDQPGQAAPAPISSMNFKVGNTCDIEYRYGPRKVVRTLTVAEMSNGKVRLTAKGNDGSTGEILLEEDGTRAVRGFAGSDGRPIEFSPPIEWIKFPLSPGTTWEGDTTITGQTFKENMKHRRKAIGWEKVRVPAGEFNALKVVSTESFSGTDAKGKPYSGAATFTYWVSPQAPCLVKVESRNASGPQHSEQLMSFKEM